MPPQTPAVRAFRLRERVRMSLWVVPAIAVVGAVTLAATLVAVDHRIAPGSVSWLPFGGGPDSARNLLSVIAGSMVTSISLIFTVTMVVLQLASAQYSPRVLRSFIRDRLVQVVLAAYIATFVYCLLVLPTVQAAGDGTDEFVPVVAVSVALLLALSSLALFVRYVHHIAHSIRASTIIATIGDETRDALQEMYPDSIGDQPEHELSPPSSPPDHVVQWPSPPGVLVAVDEHALMRFATERDVVVEVLAVVGEFIPTDAPIMRVHGVTSGHEQLVQCVTVGDERTMQQDPAFGFRQIVDIAERALSPGVNDPTTAVQAIDQLHDLLRRLARREFPSPLRVDERGVLRVVAPRFGWDDYVALAFDEIRHYSGRSIQVARRLREALEDLLTVAPPDRTEILRTQLWLVGNAVSRTFDDGYDTRRGSDATAVS